MISDTMRQQYRDEGYFVLESALPAEDLEVLRRECDEGVEEQTRRMEADRVESFSIQKYKYLYFVGNRSQDPARAELRQVIFSDLLADICRATIGPNVWLFCENFVVKFSQTDSNFNWHQDAAYVGHANVPSYVNCWIALDDVSPRNGTLSVMPYSRAGSRDLLPHTQDGELLIGYSGDDPGTGIVAPAGSIAIFSSTTLHCSGANRTTHPRRIYAVQFSSAPVPDASGAKAQNMAVPFLRNSRIISDPTVTPRPVGDALRDDEKHPQSA